jgi:hypothetical protein
MRRAACISGMNDCSCPRIRHSPETCIDLSSEIDSERSFPDLSSAFVQTLSRSGMQFA